MKADQDELLQGGFEALKDLQGDGRKVDSSLCIHYSFLQDINEGCVIRL